MGSVARVTAMMPARMPRSDVKRRAALSMDAGLDVKLFDEAQK